MFENKIGVLILSIILILELGFVSAGWCGDEICDDSDGENWITCSNDCLGDPCGDNICNINEYEDCVTCEIDCGICTSCGDNICNGDENYFNCRDDCEFIYDPADSTLITGIIYNSDFSEVIEGAYVKVACGGNYLETESLSDGNYSVIFEGSVCSEGDFLYVYAYKEGIGENTLKGDIYDRYPIYDLNLSLVDVPLVPEFVTIVGILTALGSLSVFFIIRRK